MIKYLKTIDLKEPYWPWSYVQTTCTTHSTVRHTLDTPHQNDIHTACGKAHHSISLPHPVLWQIGFGTQCRQSSQVKMLQLDSHLMLQCSSKSSDISMARPKCQTRNLTYLNRIYIKTIGQLSDEPWKFFGYTDAACWILCQCMWINDTVKFLTKCWSSIKHYAGFSANKP